MLPEDDRVIETCRSVFNVLMCILDFLNNIHVHVLVCVIKRSYMFRLSDHPQGSYIVPC